MKTVLKTEEIIIWQIWIDFSNKSPQARTSNTKSAKESMNLLVLNR